MQQRETHYMFLVHFLQLQQFRVNSLSHKWTRDLLEADGDHLAVVLVHAQMWILYVQIWLKKSHESLITMAWVVYMCVWQPPMTEVINWWTDLKPDELPAMYFKGPNWLLEKILQQKYLFSASSSKQVSYLLRVWGTRQKWYCKAQLHQIVFFIPHELIRNG